MRPIVFLTILGALFALLTNNFNYFYFVLFVPVLFLDDYFVNKNSKIWKLIIAFFAIFLTRSFILFNKLFPVNLYLTFALIILSAVLYTFVFFIFHYYHKKINAFYGYFLYLGLPISLERIFLQIDSPLSQLILGNYISGLKWYAYTGALGGSLWILLVNLVIFSFLKEVLFNRNKKVIVLGIFSLLIVIGLPVSANYFIKFPPPKYQRAIVLDVFQSPQDISHRAKAVPIDLVKDKNFDYLALNAYQFDLFELLKYEQLDYLYDELLPQLKEGIIIFEDSKHSKKPKQISENSIAAAFIDKTGVEYFSKYAKFKRFPVVGNNYPVGLILGNDIYNGRKIRSLIFREDKIARYLIFYGDTDDNVLKNRANEYQISIINLKKKKMFLPENKIKITNTFFKVPIYEQISYYAMAGEFLGNLMVFLSVLLLLSGITKFAMNDDLSKLVR